MVLFAELKAVFVVVLVWLPFDIYSSYKIGRNVMLEKQTVMSEL